MALQVPAGDQTAVEALAYRVAGCLVGSQRTCLGEGAVYGTTTHS